MSTISAGTTTNTALQSTGDTTGNLVLQTNGTTTALTLNTSQALGVGSSPSYGTSGQVLTSGGSGASPTWTTLATGPMTLISTQTANNSSANLTFTNIGSYNSFLIVTNGLYPSVSTGNYIYVQVGYGATPTWVTSGYSTTIVGLNNNATGPSNYSSTGNSGILAVNSYGLDNSGSYPIGMFLYILNAQSSTANKISLGQCSFIASNTFLYQMNFTGNIPTTNVLTAVRLQLNSGNWVGGTASLYGISS